MSVYTVNIEVPNVTPKNHYDLQQAMRLAGFTRADNTAHVDQTHNIEYQIATMSDIDTVTYIAKFVASSALASEGFGLVVSTSNLYI